jgi:hypothetical protein
MQSSVPTVMHSFTTMLAHAPIVATKEMKIMTDGTWRQRMMNLFLRRERIPKQASELQKKISKDKANLEGLGEKNE